MFKYFLVRIAIIIFVLISCAHQRVKKQFDSQYRLGKDRSQDIQVMHNVLNSHREKLNDCFQDELDQIRIDGDKEKYSGEMNIEMIISSTGEARGIKIRSSNDKYSDEFKNCVRKIISQIDLPPSFEKDQTISLDFKLEVDQSNRLIWR